MSVSYNTAAISKLLNSALSDQALTLFCYNYYPTVHEKFTSEIAHLWKTQLLVDYCKRHNQLDQLLAHIAKIDPDQYKEFIETLAEPVHGSEEDIGTDRSRIEIVFDGDSADFTLELQLAAISAMAEVLEIPSDQINILLVETGSIVLQVEMPTAATSRLMSLCKANDSVIHALGIQQVRRIDERPIRPIKIQTSTSRLESGQIRELSDQKNGGSVSINSHGGSQSTAKESQGGSLMTYAQPVRLKGMSLPSDGSQGQTESPDSSVFSIDDIESSVIHEIQEPRTIEATGIPQGFINGLALKVLYFGGTMKGWQVAQAMRLHFSGVIEPILQALKAHHLVQVTGGSNLNRASYQYAITEKGAGRARELLERNRYVGPCPVTMDHYTKLVRLQAQYRSLVKEDHVRRTLRGLVLSKEIVDRIGPAVNSYKSIFVYGPPGNGKTSIAKAIGRGLLPNNIMVPYAIFEAGQIIKVFDVETHRPSAPEEAQLKASNGLDKRWVCCRAPVVATGGELTLQDLDLAWSDTNRYYEGPLQLKANGGMFLIDDFGRQQMSPRDLLNRWIVPLEERLDFLTFHTGKKFAIPFETLIVFSTNLDPESLVDDAFLRRIRHKLGIDNPSEKQFYEIFVDVCRARGIKFDKQAFVYLLREYYINVGRSLKACHPRDLIDQLTDFANYRGVSAEMSIELIDLAARSYFAELF